MEICCIFKLEFKLELCNLEGWEKVGSEREIQERGACVRLWLIHLDV